MGSNVILDGSYFVKSMLSIADISGSNTILQCITFKSNFPQQYLYTYVASHAKIRITCIQPVIIENNPIIYKTDHPVWVYFAKTISCMLIIPYLAHKM